MDSSPVMDSMCSPNIVGVVVTFNRLSQLQLTVQQSLAAGLDLLVVINNASTDGTREWLDAQTETRLVVLHLPVNVGGAGGFHHGFDYVVQHTQADWLVCYDDDAYPEPDSLKIFRQLALPDDVAGVAAAVYLPDGRISEMNRPSRDPFRSLQILFKTLGRGRLGFHIEDEAYRQTELMPIDFSSFVGCFIRVQAIRTCLGLPRKELFIYADDVIYTHQIGQSGYRHCFAPQVHFVHDCGTLHLQKAVYKPMWKAYYTYRNGLELYRLVAGAWLFWPIALLKLVFWLSKVKFYENKRVYLRLTWIAWLHGMQRKFDISHERVLQLAA